MLRFSDARNFGRTLAGLSLIVGPLLLLLGTIVGPDLSSDAPERLRNIAENEGRFIASGYLFLAASYVLVPGLVGLIRVFRDSGVTLGQVAAALVLVGAISPIAFFGAGVFEYESTRSGFDQAQMAQLSDKAEDSGLVIPLIVLFLAGIVIGLLLLAVAVWRRGVAPRWAAVAIGLAAIASFLGGEDQLLGVIGFALLLVGLGTLGVRMLSMTDEEWAALGQRQSPSAPPPAAPPVR